MSEPLNPWQQAMLTLTLHHEDTDTIAAIAAQLNDKDTK